LVVFLPVPMGIKQLLAEMKKDRLLNMWWEAPESRKDEM
jgi:hypothetical protein